MARFRWLVSLVFLCSCGVGVVDQGAGPVSDDADALSTVKAGYVTVQKSASGYTLSQANHAVAPIEVAALDFSESNLSDDVVNSVLAAPAAELLLYGKLTRTSRVTHTRNFVVLDAYRGMPGRTPATTDHFYSVASNGRQCIQAPCDSLTATKVSSTAKPKNFTTLSVASAAAAFVDQAWLSQRVLGAGAIVAATFTSGTRYPNGTESVLDASQVYLHLPDSKGACPQHITACAGGQVNVYQRDANRCVVDVGCASPGMCPMFVPSCPAGYTLSSWRSGPSACPTYACDPSWL